VVKNGLESGTILLDAASGNMTGANSVTTGNLSVTGISNLGNVGNVKITGGANRQTIFTDGTGNLTFAPSDPAPMPYIIGVGNAITVTANYQGLFGYPITIDGQLTVDGILIDVNDATVPAGNKNYVQYNNGNVMGGDANFYYTAGNGTMTVQNETITGNSTIGNLVTSLTANLGSVSNVRITGGTSGQYLQTDGTGNLSWAAGGGGGGGSPGGVNAQVQFNDAGAFAGNTGFTFNKTTGIFSASYVAGDGNGLSNIQGANVSGAVGTAGTVTTNAQPNITSVGTLTSLTINGNISANNANITGNIVPTSNNTYSLGSASSYWKDAFIGPGSLYINGVKVLEESSNAIVISADLNQTVKVTSSGSGDVQLQTTGTGVIAVKGPLQIQAANYITSSTGGPIGFSNPINVDTLSSLSANTNLTISANGTGNVQINDDLTITGNLAINGGVSNLSVTSLTVEDNIIDISAETTGVPVNNAGIRVIRGDDPAVQIRWNETSDTWQVTNDGSIYFNIVGSNTTTGNANVGNIGATSGIFTNVSGNGSALTSITGANVTGQVTYAATANSVAVANVSGIGNIATTNYNGNGSQVLAGNGAWINSSGGGGTSAAAAVGYSLIFGG
jgi:hypothetical protein